MYTTGAGCAIALLPDFNSSVFIMRFVNLTAWPCMITLHLIVGLRTILIVGLYNSMWARVPGNCPGNPGFKIMQL